MPNDDETRGHAIEIIVVVQLSALLAAVMFYQFFRLPQSGKCQAQSSSVTKVEQKSVL